MIRNGTHCLTATPLLVVVDEHVVPGDGPHVEGIQRAPHPQEGEAEEGEEKHVWPKTDTAAGAATTG